MVFAKSAGASPCRFPARRDDAEPQPPDKDRTLGGIAVAQIEGWIELRGCREVSAYSPV
jgi:hypothetical protein